MENNNFKESQRQAFARLLAEVKKREATKLESACDADDRTLSEVLEKLAQERGASNLIANLRAFRKKVDEAEEALGKLGFDCDEESIRLKWGAPKDLRDAVEAAKRSAREERERTLKQYDRAILSVWAAENVQEARKIVEEVL